MTITEAAKAGIAKLRRPEWHKDTYARIDLCGDGMHGPWVTLVEPGCEPAQVLVFSVPQDGWEAFDAVR